MYVSSSNSKEFFSYCCQFSVQLGKSDESKVSNLETSA